MQRITPHQAQQGFMTIAQNTKDTDYLKLAYVQALSIKLTMPGSLYAIAVDKSTMTSITDAHRKVFDYIILIENDTAEHDDWKLSNEWQAFYLTPFKETIKLESDILFTRDISHWWHTFRLRDIVLSLGCRNFKQEVSNSMHYRELFEDNDLPNTYSGLMYFRYTQDASAFFLLSEQIFKHWDYLSNNVLYQCHDEYPTTDVVYALAAKILGVEKCTIPSVDWINFVHMKPAINLWQNSPWHEVVFCETELPMIRINNINQYHPIHYHEKTWVTDDLVAEYEQCLQL